MAHVDLTCVGSMGFSQDLGSSPAEMCLKVTSKKMQMAGWWPDGLGILRFFLLEDLGENLPIFVYSWKTAVDVNN